MAPWHARCYKQPASSPSEHAARLRERQAPCGPPIGRCGRSLLFVFARCRVLPAGAGCSWRQEHAGRPLGRALRRHLRCCRRRPGPGASTETRGLFTEVLPQAVLDQPVKACGQISSQRHALGCVQRRWGAPPLPKRRAMIDGREAAHRTPGGANELYIIRLQGGAACAVTAARRAGGRASAAGERRVHGAGAHAGPRLQQAGRWHALPGPARAGPGARPSLSPKSGVEQSGKKSWAFPGRF